jgi:hypothetical protein
MWSLCITTYHCHFRGWLTVNITEIRCIWPHSWRPYSLRREKNCQLNFREEIRMIRGFVEAKKASPPNSCGVEAARTQAATLTSSIARRVPECQGVVASSPVVIRFQPCPMFGRFPRPRIGELGWLQCAFFLPLAQNASKGQVKHMLTLGTCRDLSPFA